MKNTRAPWHFPEGDELESFLKAQIHNRARTCAQKERRRGKIMRPLDETVQPRTEDQPELNLVVKQAFARLNPMEQKLLRLDARGNNASEIAAQLGIHRNSAPNIRGRAHEKLRQALGSDGLSDLLRALQNSAL